MSVRIKKPQITLKLSKDAVFAFLAAVMFTQQTFFEYFRVLIGKLPVISPLQNLFFPFLYTLLLVFSYKKGRLKNQMAAIGIPIFVVISILLTDIFYPQNIQYITNSLFSEILPCLPFLVLGLCMMVDKTMFDMVSKLSCASILVSTLYVLYFVHSGRMLDGMHGEGYSMYWSYLLLPNTLFSINYAFRRRKVFPTICSIVGCVYAFAMGTRGPIVIIAVFVVINIINIWEKLNMKTSKKILLMALIGMLAATFLLPPLYMTSLSLMRNFISHLGLSTRVIDYLMNGEMLSYTSGRDVIYRDLIAKLTERPFFGYGVFGEYSFGYEAGAHNIYLQMLFDFGYPMGIVLMLVFIIIFFRAWGLKKNLLAHDWITMFGCLVFVKGIFGGSFLDRNLFFLLGLCLYEIRVNGKRKRVIGEKGYGRLSA